jgi:small multidrug resistance pump
MIYLTLAGAIVMEVLGTTAMKYSHGFTKLWPSLATAVCYVLAFTLLAQTLKAMEIGVAYAVWAGAGTALIAAIGMIFLSEGVTAVKMLGLGLVIAGVVVLNVGGAH